MRDLSMHIMDIMQNSISANATRIEVRVEIDSEADILSIEILDDGFGMSEQQLERLNDPFYTSRTVRKVGLGVPLFLYRAEQSGGELKVVSKVGEGTRIIATFGYKHLDRAPMGDLANSFILVVSSNPDIDFMLNYSRDGREYRFDTLEIKEVLDGAALTEPKIVKMLNEFLHHNLLEIDSDFGK